MKMATSLLRTTAQKLLSNNEFDIEFNGYLSNHAKHAIVALEGLQAPESRIQEYWDEYTSVTPYGLHLHTVDQKWESVSALDRSKWDSVRGTKTLWQEQVALMNDELQSRFKGDSKALIQSYAPVLLDGMAGALTHGIIHLGWAIDGKNDWMVCEGLAYLNFCYLGVDPSKFTQSTYDDSSLLGALTRVAETFEADNLQETWVETSKASHDESFHSELVPAGFQWQLSKVLHDAHPVATQVPAFLYTNSDLEGLFESLYKDIVMLYLTTVSKEGHGSFLILHAITSLWALEQTTRVIDDPSVTLRALRQYYASVVCLLATSGFPASESLKSAQTKYGAKIDAEGLDWTPIVKAGIAEQEEHNIKLVHVSKKLWERYGRWSGFSQAARTFTLTPNIGPANTAFSASD